MNDACTPHVNEAQGHAWTLSPAQVERRVPKAVELLRLARARPQRARGIGLGVRVDVAERALFAAVDGRQTRRPGLESEAVAFHAPAQ